MRPSRLNRDIIVSLIFSILAAIFLLAILFRGFFIEGAALAGPLLRYGLPFGALSLFFYWTADKKNVDRKNHIAIKTSFHIAFFTTVLAAVFFVLSIFLFEI